MIRTTSIAAVAGCLLLAWNASPADPLATRDQNPFLAGFGLPRPMPSRVDHWQWNADFNWANSSVVQAAPRERLTVDAETRDLRATFTGKVADRWLVSASIPWRSTSAGSLDSFIDGWHDFFGMPQGNRDQFRDDELLVLYGDRRSTRISRREPMSGIGDIDVAAGLELLADPASSLTVWFDAKLPTGSASELNGSGAVDLSLIVSGERRFAERWSVFGQLGASRLGESDILSDIERDWIGSALAGVTRRCWQSLDLTVQVDAHTAAFDSNLPYLSDAVILSFGGAWHFSNGFALSLGLSEDIAVERSPDVVFIVGVRGAL